MNIDIGNLYLTRGVAEKVEQNELCMLQMLASLKRHQDCDFSDMEYEEDIELNKIAASRKCGRVLSSYNCGCLGEIWIITYFLQGQMDLAGKLHEANETTVLFPEEY